MHRFKKCPRCGGTMFLEADSVSWYEECLQCSYCHELKDIMVASEESVRQSEDEPANLCSVLR